MKIVKFISESTFSFIVSPTDAASPIVDTIPTGPDNSFTPYLPFIRSSSEIHIRRAVDIVSLTE